MGFFQRLFGLEKPADAQVNPQPTEEKHPETGGEVPPERMGVNGEFDQNGLAKRVALAFDEDESLDDLNSLFVAQTGGTVVLRGEVPSQDKLNQAIQVAEKVNGATSVNSDDVIIAP